MKRLLTIVILVMCWQLSIGQSFTNTFNKRVQQFLNDPAFSHAVIGLQVYDARTGKVVVEHNAQAGVPGASTQKIITDAAAFDLLGNNFRFQTKIGYKGDLSDGILHGDIIIKGSGDPSLGSWRYRDTKENQLINEIVAAVRQAGIRQLDGHVLVDESVFDGEPIPDGWIWQDIGNYYGAGAHGLNWRENQYDLFLKSGSSIGSPVSIVGTKPAFIPGLYLVSDLKAAGARTGDNAYIYFPSFGLQQHVRGTIPINQNQFTISGSIPNPAWFLGITLEAAINKKDIQAVAVAYPMDAGTFSGSREIHTIESPTLDSISYWFLNKSINLYGESLLKTMGSQFGKSGSTSEGVRVVKDFWSKKGIDKYALGIIDGSGLSPQNRITADALVRVLRHAKSQSWYDAFYAGLPVIHGIKMKSGTIGGSVAYTGYISSAKGDFVFAAIVTNYRGGAGQTRQKIWNLLDGLK